MRAAVIIEALTAEYGDSLLVTCSTPKGDWRLLVDTGPPECWPSLQARLAQIPADRVGHRHQDLVVITHIDDDHIGAAAALFGDRTRGLTLGRSSSRPKASLPLDFMHLAWNPRSRF